MQGRHVRCFLPLLFLVGAPALAQEETPADSASARDSIISQVNIPFEKYTLDNGLEVILHENHRLPVVAVNLWYHAGPINEEPKRTGFAHLFEHLMFQGSKHVGDDMHFRLLESAGASSVNGTTGYDRTNYYQTVPANQLELALWLESDRMGFLLESLTEAKLENQREVVKNERRQSLENRPYGPSYEKFIQTLFPAGHPYYGAVIGSMEDLEAASLQDVRDFYTSYYAPGNATLVIAGDFNKEDAKALVEKYFGTLPPRPKPPKRPVDTPAITQQRRVEVKEPVMLPRLQIGWLSPAFLQPGDAEADVLATVLGGGKSSRLYRKLVYELELAQSVSVYQQSNQLKSIFTVSVIGRPGVDLEQLEKETFALLEQIRQEGATEEEVVGARNQLVTHTVESLQEVGNVANRLNSYNHYVGDPGYFEEDLARYLKVDAAAVKQLAADLLDPDHAVVIHTVPAAPTGGAQ